MNTVSSIIAVTLTLAVYALLHYAVYTRVASGLGLSAPERRTLMTVLALAGLCIIGAEAFRRASWVVPLRYVGSVWLGVLALAVSLLAVESTLSLAWPRVRRATTVIALAALAFLVVCTLVNGGRRPLVKDVSVRSERLPAELSGFTLVPGTLPGAGASKR